MSLSMLTPHDSPAGPPGLPPKAAAPRKVRRETVADGVWVLGAMLLFVIFQVVALL